MWTESQSSQLCSDLLRKVDGGDGMARDTRPVPQEN